MSAPSAPVVIARYGELWLKGKNRGEFERVLVHNVRAALSTLDPGAAVVREHGLLVIRPTRRVHDVARRLQEVFGFSSLSVARGAPSEPEAIVPVAHEVLGAALEGYPRERAVRFRISTKRAEKRFPLNSQQLDRLVAERLPPALAARLAVDLDEPELVLGIHVRTGTSYVYAARLSGAGGLPVNSVGRAIVLLSGGIDSPVAAWRMMRRGCRVDFVHFHSMPFHDRTSQDKARELARLLVRWQLEGVLNLVPFGEVQRQIVAAVRRPLRVVLYRRMMLRIAEAIARRRRAEALVTGESLGQVASQTLGNLAVIEAAAELPVLRPLIGMDKGEISDAAAAIGTFETSIIPDQDCCQLFVPRHPSTRASLAAVLRAERTLDVPALVALAVDATETVRVRFPETAGEPVELAPGVSC